MMFITFLCGFFLALLLASMAFLYWIFFEKQGGGGEQ